jgi:hypothetical protein
MAAVAHRFRLEHEGQLLELSAWRGGGLRTRVELFVNGHKVGEASGVGRVLAHLPAAPRAAARLSPGTDAGSSDQTRNESSQPMVLVLSVLPGIVRRALLLVPRPDSTGPDADPDWSDEAQPDDEVMPASPKGVDVMAELVAAERHSFDPPPGSFAARLLIFQRNHPGLYASRHVVRAVGRIAAGLLGLLVFVRLLLQPALHWITERLPDIDLPAIPWPDIGLPAIPWPDIGLPAIPWPDIDLPDLAVPSWLGVIVGTAKFWLPVLTAIGVALAEIRRRRAVAARDGNRDAHR